MLSSCHVLLGYQPQTRYDMANQESLSMQVHETYGGHLRFRACAIIGNKDHVLLVKHQGLGKLGYYWSPPGGGVEFGEELGASVKREVLEETGLIVSVGHFAFGNQYIRPPLHAVELFFHASVTGGSLILGNDPEWTKPDKMVVEVDWVPWEILNKLPKEAKHHCFKYADNWEALCGLAGFLPPQLP
jgi:8-oxo-dGTP diphosphatase